MTKSSVAAVRTSSPARAASVSIVDRDAAAIVRQANTNPALRAFSKAEGIYLWDESGSRIIDAYGNNCHHVGYAHPKLIEAIDAQMRSLCFVPRGFTNETVVRAAERLRRLWPYGTSSVCFVPGGSAATEVALMICRVHTGRYKTASFYGAYHGRSSGALSLSGRVTDRPHFLGPLLPGAIHIPAYYSMANGKPTDAAGREEAAKVSIEVLHQCFQSEGEIAALFAEPIRSGPYLPPKWYWPKVRELCTKYGVLLVSDEIPTGLGKTGRMFTSEVVDCVPDITLVGKALGGAMVPVAGVIISEDLDTTARLNLGYYTYERSPILATAADTVLGILEEMNLPDAAQAMGEVAEDLLLKVAKRQRVITEVRAAGLMLGITLEDRSPQKALPYEVYKECIQRGLLMLYNPWSGLTFTFPLVIDRNALKEAIGIFEQALVHVMNK